MTTSALASDGIDSIGFVRLHALVARGYRPLFGASTRADGHVCINLMHPRAGRKVAPPPLTLWSDGIVSTPKVLFPERFVPEEGQAPPAWQRYILPAEADRFDSFAASIVRPDAIDLYLKPAWEQARIFAAKLMIGSSLCVILGLAGKVILSEV